METDRFQALFRVITLGSIQIENDQIEKPSTKELTAWLLSKLHVKRQLNYRLKMITLTERFRASSCKHYKAAEKKLAALLPFHPWEFMGKYHYLAC